MASTSHQGFDLMDSGRVLDDGTSNEMETIEEYNESNDTSGTDKMFECPVEELAEFVGPMEPYVGMEFKSADDGRDYYCAYARRNGFTIRVNRKRRSRIDHAVIGYDYVCSKEGFQRKKYLREDRLIRLSKQTRVGCKAILVIAYRRDGDKWIVTNFLREHNHELMAPSEVPVRRSDKALHEDEKDRRIRELTNQLYAERQRCERRCAAYEERCAAYKIHLSKILRDIEIHTDHLTKKVRGIVESIREIEDEEPELRLRPAI